MRAIDQRRLTVLVVFVLLGGHASTVRADIINAGETIPLFGTTLNARPDLDRPVNREAIVPFGDINGAYYGHVEVRMLDYWGEVGLFGSQQQFRIVDFDDGGRGYTIEVLRTDDHFGVEPFTDINFMLDGVGIHAPDSGFWQGGGSGVEFYFPSPVPSGSDSMRVYYLAGGDLTDGLDHWGAAVGVRTPAGELEFAPFENWGPYIPMPAAWMGLSFGLLAARWRRRRTG